MFFSQQNFMAMLNCWAHNLLPSEKLIFMNTHRCASWVFFDLEWARMIQSYILPLRLLWAGAVCTGEQFNPCECRNRAESDSASCPTKTACKSSGRFVREEANWGIRQTLNTQAQETGGTKSQGAERTHNNKQWINDCWPSPSLPSFSSWSQGKVVHQLFY